MSRWIVALAALAAFAAAPAVSFADGPATRSAPRSYQSPTDEYVPPARTAPRAQRLLRRAPALHEGTLTAYIRALPAYLPPPSLGEMAPAGGPTYSYFATPAASTYYYYPYPPSASSYSPESAAPPVPPGVFTRQDFDGAPCPTPSRTSLGALFACTR